MERLEEFLRACAELVPRASGNEGAAPAAALAAFLRSSTSSVGSSPTPSSSSASSPNPSVPIADLIRMFSPEIPVESSPNLSSPSVVGQAELFPSPTVLPARGISSAPIPTLNLLSGQVSNGAGNGLVYLEGNGTGFGAARNHRAVVRSSLFPTLQRAPDRRANNRREEPVPQVFRRSFTLIPIHRPTNRPTNAQLAENAAQGFGEVSFEFLDNDSQFIVAEKIYGGFPALQAIRGGFQMYHQTGRGNSTTLKAFGKPVLSGKELKSLSYCKFYIAPLLNETFPNSIVLSGTPVSCPICSVEMDMAIVARHFEICEAARNQAARHVVQEVAVPTPVAANLLAEAPIAEESVAAVVVQPVVEEIVPGEYSVAREGEVESVGQGRNQRQLDDGRRILEAHQSMVRARFTSRGANRATFERNALLNSALNYSLDDLFMSKIGQPCVFSLDDEVGIDAGGIRRYVLSSILNLIEDGALQQYQQLYRNPAEAPSEDAEELGISPGNVRDRLFSFGLFCGLAVIHCSLCPEFIVRWVLLLADEEDHPFLEGLDSLQVAKLILENPPVRHLFKSADISLQDCKGLFKRVIAVDPLNDHEELRDLAEEASFGHFMSFLEDVNGGLVQPLAPITLRKILEFCTGSSILPSAGSRPSIVVRFEQSPRRNSASFDAVAPVFRPVASTCSSVLTLPLTRSSEQMAHVWVSALLEGGEFFLRA